MKIIVIWFFILLCIVSIVIAGVCNDGIDNDGDQMLVAHNGIDDDQDGEVDEFDEGIDEEEVDNAVASLSSLLEPIIMVVIGTLVGGLIVAMYLPIFKMAAAV